MKAGIAAAVFAAEAIERAGVTLPGTIEISGTVDEESGGFAGVAYLAETGRIAQGPHRFRDHPRAAQRRSHLHRPPRRLLVRGDGARPHRPRQHAVSRRQRDRRHGPAAAVGARRADAGAGVAANRGAGRAAGARHATININGIEGGQPVDGIQTPCIADLCRAVFDRRFLIEEGFDAAKQEIADARRAGRRRRPRRPLRPARPDGRAPDEDAGRLAGDRGRSSGRFAACSGRRAELIASPGTYDHKHVARIAGVPHCVAYGPGELEQAHQPDEYCRIDDLVNATKVIALATLDLMGAGR